MLSDGIIGEMNITEIIYVRKFKRPTFIYKKRLPCLSSHTNTGVRGPLIVLNWGVVNTEKLWVSWWPTILRLQVADPCIRDRLLR